jgi:probable phosphoglycerate mutase
MSQQPTTLIIIRHGNTFNPGETPRRIGARTDIPLVPSGRKQAAQIGKYLRRNRLVPDIVYSSDLKRTQETAELALLEANINIGIHKLGIFNEIDYGPDENLPEEEVIARIGSQAIEDWNTSAKVPPGWNVIPQKIIANWQEFANELTRNYSGKTVLVVTSNGIARFAPHILDEAGFENFLSEYKLKISTGAICIFSNDGTRWSLEHWNLKP